MIKIGIAGCRGLSTLQGLHDIEDVQITAMCDLNEEHLKFLRAVAADEQRTD